MIFSFTEKRITSLRGGIVTLGNFLIHLIPSQSGVIPWIQVESFNFQGCEGAVFGNPKAITTSALFNALLQSPYLAALANEFKRSIKEGIICKFTRSIINPFSRIVLPGSLP